MADSVDWSAPAASAAWQPIRHMATAAGAALFRGAAGRDGEAALDALARFRVLCAHRHGPSGVSSWTRRIEDWLSVSLAEFATGTSWYLGRPVMVTANDYGLRLFNGDTGVVVAREDGGVTVAFRRAGALVTISPGPADDGRHRLRHDGAQGAGIGVPGGGRRAALRRRQRC